MFEGGEEVSTDVGRRLSLGLRLGELVNKVSVVGDPLMVLVLVGAIGLRPGEYVLEGGEEVSTDVGRRLGRAVDTMEGKAVGSVLGESVGDPLGISVGSSLGRVIKSGVD